MTAIFQSTEQALHVSFLVTSLPPRQKQQFRLALIQILESIGELDRRQAAFLDYLYGTSSGTICFDGLTGDEIRAQCAMIVAAVRDRLPKPERNAVWLRYARGIPAQPARAGRAADPGVPPSQEWKLGLFGMAAYLRPSLTLTTRDPILTLLAAHAFPHQRERAFSYKAISEEHKIPVRTLERNAAIIRKRLRGLELQAINRLTEVFQRDGVVDFGEVVEIA
ncbi:hypothetical protein WK80_22300 [Burkholderia multivorans]|uniref:hypothetical protein n=1 Tax=Burkholderia multivorans TaxID=87883 RepID=UPI00075E7AE6|nr:hypothetical protein [Burkholderia multivorans]KVV22323.1 hypothetical protein WK80_22300 [Burkholderia multivorans]MBU9203109.1 hypothetical protein [Burkholderia multivorans]MCA8385348.1 hypothetical protein [Burkholderia multivorans]